MPQTMQEKDIRRKDTPDKKTLERDDMADTIEDMWPANLSAMAEEAGYSRQHAKNTLSSHFEVIESDENQENNDSDTKTPRSIEIPENVENDADYLQGWLNGRRK